MMIFFKYYCEIVYGAGNQMKLQNKIQIVVWLTALGMGFLSWNGPLAFSEVVSFEGQRIQGGLLQGKVAKGARVDVNGKKVRVSSEGIFLVGFDRDAAKEVEVAVINRNGKVEKKVLPVARRTYKIQRVNGLPPRKVNPKKEDVARIQEDVRLAKEARKFDDPRTDFLGGFIWPVEGKITGVYGSQRILNGEPRRPHYGIDIAAPTGTPVVAPADGVVTMVHRDMFFSGGTMILDHGHGLSSAFLHLHKILVNKGDRVKKGEVIAEVGATGRVTGPHLDWRINLFQQRLDPQLLVSAMPTKK
jgi:murein DD-endopeptidase MepM/ murein hydrolase activator NlpD